jgi:hypothetical protein
MWKQWKESTVLFFVFCLRELNVEQTGWGHWRWDGINEFLFFFDVLGRLVCSCLELVWNYESYRQFVGLLGRGSARIKVATHTVQRHTEKTHTSMPRVGFKPISGPRHFVPYAKISLWWGIEKLFKQNLWASRSLSCRPCRCFILVGITALPLHPPPPHLTPYFPLHANHRTKYSGSRRLKFISFPWTFSLMNSIKKIPVTEFISFWGTQQSRCLPLFAWGRKFINSFHSFIY